MFHAGVVWLDGSNRPKGEPIRRRWRLRIGGRLVLSIPLRPVSWSRQGFGLD